MEVEGLQTEQHTLQTGVRSAETMTTSSSDDGRRSYGAESPADVGLSCRQVRHATCEALATMSVKGARHDEQAILMAVSEHVGCKNTRPNPSAAAPVALRRPRWLGPCPVFSWPRAYVEGLRLATFMRRQRFDRNLRDAGGSAARAGGWRPCQRSCRSPSQSFETVSPPRLCGDCCLRKSSSLDCSDVVTIELWSQNRNWQDVMASSVLVTYNTTGGLLNIRCAYGYIRLWQQMLWPTAAGFMSIRHLQACNNFCKRNKHRPLSGATVYRRPSIFLQSGIVSEQSPACV